MATPVEWLIQMARQVAVVAGQGANVLDGSAFELAARVDEVIDEVEHSAPQTVLCSAQLDDRRAGILVIARGVACGLRHGCFCHGIASRLLDELNDDLSELLDEQVQLDRRTASEIWCSWGEGGWNGWRFSGP